MENLGIYGALMGPKSENVEKSVVLPLLFEGSRAAWLRQPNEKPSEPDRLGGGRGRVNPPPRRLVWRFWEVWRVCKMVRGLYTPRGRASADFRGGARMWTS